MIYKLGLSYAILRLNSRTLRLLAYLYKIPEVVFKLFKGILGITLKKIEK